MVGRETGRETLPAVLMYSPHSNTIAGISNSPPAPPMIAETTPMPNPALNSGGNLGAERHREGVQGGGGGDHQGRAMSTISAAPARPRQRPSSVAERFS
ncbi:hypothetical protein ACIP2X_07295 [Streptomyces sp. NPDC089424]|uniref:hypothetical protein n=1 Tax=Streptomyces sp. NPDC089424 TaxID=3365917 RepID=UPI003816DAD4